jgi:hypothetical protein
MGMNVPSSTISPRRCSGNCRARAISRPVSAASAGQARGKLGRARTSCKRFGMIVDGTKLGSRSTRIERRINRSSDALVALSRLLESTRARAHLPALAVADSSGLLVAGAGMFQDCEELAAYAPLLVHSKVSADDELALASLTEASSVQRVAVDGLEVLVCGRGDAADCERALPELASGCQRILRTREPVL